MRFLTKKFIIGAVAVLVVGLIGWSYISAPETVPYEFIEAKRMDLTEEVSVTGKVEPAQSVDLAFEKGGRAARVHVKVGSKVAAGAVLVELDQAELSAQLAEMEAALLAAQAKLSEMKLGTRPEEISLAQIKFANAEKTLAETRTKADADLKDDYDSALSAAVKSVSVAVNGLLVLTDLQNAHFSGFDQQSVQVADAKAAAIKELLGAAGSGRANKDYISQLTGGAKGSVLLAQANQTFANIDKALADTKAGLAATKVALDAVPVLTKFTATEATNLNTEKNNVSSESITVASKQQAIEVQKAAAASAITEAENARAAAEADLAIKKAGYTKEQIAGQEAAVAQASARVETARATRAKAVLTAPIAGVITKQDVKVGQIVSAGVSVVSLISEAEFEIEANIPEADIAKVQPGNRASVTLDAYGNDVPFSAVVSEVDPAETVVEGVPTYKVNLHFVGKDGRIKSGMTANTDIITGEKRGVVAVPQRAVSAKEGKKFVQIVQADGSLREVEVQTGLRGSDGSIEMVKGVNEGDKVVTFIRE